MACTGLLGEVRQKNGLTPLSDVLVADGEMTRTPAGIVTLLITAVTMPLPPGPVIGGTPTLTRCCAAFDACVLSEASSHSTSTSGRGFPLVPPGMPTTVCV